MAEGSDRALRMMAAALEKEEYGLNFYKEASAKCGNELGREIFSKLMVEEGIHIKRIKEIYQSLQGGQPWPKDWKQYKQENDDLQALFRKRMKEHGPKIEAGVTDLEAVNTGLEFEQGAIDFYEKALKEASDPQEKEFIEIMIDEERTHFASLSDTKQFLTDPEAWFIETERGQLDGA